MATLVLSAVGGAIGGPFGALAGAAAGLQIDRAILAPGGGESEGPRLSDTKVQSAALGAPIPLVYGRARVAGNVLWTSGLKETRTEKKQSSGGKGARPSTTTVEFSYSASIAVGISGRRIIRIERIWADGKLLRDATGNLLAPVTIRVHDGDERQAADPLLQASEGMETMPPFRGLAYVVLEDLQLAEFANRIPNLSFEVVADEDLTLGDPVQDIASRLDGLQVETAQLTLPVTGLVAPDEGPVRSVLEALARTYLISVTEMAGRLVFLRQDGPQGDLITVKDRDLGAALAGDSRAPRIVQERLESGEQPLQVDLRHGDPQRDYQVSVQRAQIQAGHTHRRLTEDSPTVMQASDARQRADEVLNALWQRQETFSLSLPARYLGLVPGDLVSFPVGDAQRAIRVEDVQFSPIRIGISGPVIEPRGDMASEDAESGDFPDGIVIPPGPTRLDFLDFPGIGNESARPQMLVAASGAGPSWPGANIFLSRDLGESFDFVQAIPSPAVTGTTIDAMPEGPAAFWDEASSVTVMLDDPAEELESRSALSVLNGGNRAVIGSEVVQFSTASLQPDGSYRLSGLLRGRNGTEHAMAGHAAGERFVLLDGGGLVAVDLPTELLGRQLQVRPVTVNRALDETETQVLAPEGLSLRPLSPVHARARRDGAGNILLSWIRRARQSGAWRDNSDVPLGEEVERYEVDIIGPAGDIRRTFAVTSAEAVYTASDQIADFGAQPTQLDLEIFQISAVVGRGEPWTGALQVF